MGVVTVLFILVVGFVFCHKHPVYYFKLHRYEGQYLYLQVAFWGLVCFIISTVLNVLLIEFFSITACNCGEAIGWNYVDWIAKYITETKIEVSRSNLMSWLIVVSVTALAIPSLWSHLQYAYKKHALGLDTNEEVDVFIMSRIFADSPLDSILLSSILEEKLLMLVLNDRKVYVGRIASMGEPNENEGADQEVNIIPILSGYRHKDTLELTFTTDYKKIGGELSLVIKQESIISARFFDPQIFVSFGLVISNDKS
jgi:hypothetical protein